MHYGRRLERHHHEAFARLSPNLHHQRNYALQLHRQGYDTGGFFSSIGKALKKVVKTVAKPVASVTKVVMTPITAPLKLSSKVLGKIPVLGGVVKAVNSVALAPINMTQAVLEGGRIDKVALAGFKQVLADAKTLAPVVQSIISFVPGIGTGMSAAIGAGLALAEGKNITQALLAGVKGAIPGGPLAQSAFSIAQAAIERKPIDQVLLSALPISDQQKQLLGQGLAAVKDIASGKNVAHSIVDHAIESLPPQFKNAVQIGMAMGHAKNLQDALKTGVVGAASIGLKAAAPALASVAGKVVPKNVVQIANDLAKAKKQLTPSNALALAKKNLPPAASLAVASAMTAAQKGIPLPMRSPMFTRANSLPVISLARQASKLSAIPSATKAVVDAIRKNPSLLSSSRQLLAQGMRTNGATVNDAMATIARQQMGRGLLPWRSMSPQTVSFIRKYAPNAPLTALRHAHTNVGGLDSTGTTYIVEKGDGPWKIAQKLTGNGNRWPELKDYNKDKKPTIDKNVWVGEIINLPPSWQKPVAASKPNTPALPSVPTPTIAPAPDPVTQVTNAATSVVPSILQAKAILAAWGKTDGINQSGLPDYGLNPADMSTSMGPRDTMMLQSFQVWDNKTLNEGLPVDGNLDSKSLSSLQNWASSRANAAVPSSTPTVNVPDAPAVTVVVPAPVGGTAPDPTITITPKPSTPATPTPTVATAAKPAQGGSMAPMAIGAIVGGLLFGVPGALVGAAGGAAIS
jgi:hypothetical protein